MKKLLAFAIIVSFVFPITALALPTQTSLMNILPFVNNTYSLGTSTLRWANGFFSEINTPTTTFNGVSYYWPATDGTVNQVLTTDSAGVLSWSTASGGGGGASSMWLVNGFNAYASTTFEAWNIGGTTSSTADIVFGDTGYAIFNEQGLAKNFRVESDNNPYMVFVDGTNDKVGINTQAPSSTLHIVGTFKATGAIQASSTLEVTGATQLAGLNAGATTLTTLGATTGTFSGAVRASSTLEVSSGAAFSASTTMQTLPASKVVVTDANRNLAGSIVTGTELSYVSGVTSAIQTQLDGKQASGSYALQSTTISAGGLLTGGGDLSTNRTITFASSSLNLGTMSIQNANAVAITGGTITGITDLAIADGGTATSSIAADNGVFVSNGTNWRNAVLPSCSDGTTSKLLYNSTTYTFSCGTDQNTGGGGGSSTDWVGSGTTLTASSTYNLVQVFGTASSSQLRSPSSTLGTINGTIAFTGAVNSSSTFTNSGATILGSTLQTGGAATFLGAQTTTGTATFNGTLNASSSVNASGAVILGSTFQVGGTSTFLGTANHTGAINASSTFTNSAATILGSTLQVGSGATFLSTTSHTGTATFSGTINASSSVNGSGAVILGSTLQVGGAATLLSTLNVSAKTTTANVSSTQLTVSGNTNLATLQTSGNFTAGASTTFGGVTYSWPVADGSSGSILATNGAGQLTWATDQTGAGAATYWILSGSTLYSTSTATSVGIGTPAPSSTLHVVGTLQASATSTLSGGLIIPFSTAPALATSGAISINTKLGTLSYASGTTQFNLNPEKCLEPAFTIEYAATSTAEDIPLMFFNSTSTITKVKAVNRKLGDTINFGLGFGSSRATATSSLNKVFTSIQTVTATTSLSSLTVNGSTTASTGDIMRFFTTSASSSQFTVSVCYKENQ